MNILELHNDCCFNVLPKIDSASKKLILIDPPYGKTDCEWDKRLDIDAFWKEHNRIIQDNGVIAVFGQEPFSTEMRMANIKNYRYDWYWVKPNGTNPFAAKKRPMDVVENIMIFYKKAPLYNPQMREGKPYVWDSKRSGGDAGGIKFEKDKPIHNPGVRYPINILNFRPQRGLHPTQKPIELIKYIILTYTNEGDCVLDSTMGSGTTGEACVKLNRGFIGVEKDEKIFKIAYDRILGG